MDQLAEVGGVDPGSAASRDVGGVGQGSAAAGHVGGVGPGSAAAGYVGVVGPGREATAEQVRLAQEVGRLLAGRHLVVVTGGLDGVMAAAARGCELAGGLSVGLLPGLDRRAANPHSTVTLPTGLGELRNGLLVRASDAVVAVGSSWGTLSEVALAVRTGVPVLLLGWDDLADHLPTRPERASTPEQAVAAVTRLLGRGSTGTTA